MDVCRTCLNERGSELVGSDFRSIFTNIEVDEVNVYIADCLTQWVDRTIVPGDGMPSEICQPCLEAIKSITLFIQNAKECDDHMRRIIQSGDAESLNDIESFVDLEIKLEVEDTIDTLPEEEEAYSDHEQHRDTKALLDPKEKAIKRRHVRQETVGKPNKISESFETDMFDESDDYQLSDSSSSDFEESNDSRPKRSRKKRTEASKKENKTNDNGDRDESEAFNVIDVQDQIVCCGCWKLFDNEKELKLHGVVIHEETKRKNNRVNADKKFVCRFCYKRFSTKSLLQAHRNRNQCIDKVYECKKCNRRFLNVDAVKKHALGHLNQSIEPPKLYPVSIARLEKHGYLCCVKKCTSSHSSEDALLEHISKDHNLTMIDALYASSEFQCPFCRKPYESKAKLNAHYVNRYTLLQSTAAHHQCSQCGKIYKSEISLKAHENKHAQIRPYECDVCSKSFYSDAVLKQHKLIHTQGKTLTCLICGMAFRTKMFLENHYRVHSDDKPFVCDICQKSFRHSSSLFIHKRTHDQVKRHKCSECGKGFTDTANLNRHMVSHTGIKPYQCNHCEKRFMRLTERTEHESIVHMGVMPYGCEICGEGFPSKRTFLKHESACSGSRFP
ncbi:zinc finger protein 2-like [Aedes aegypti]|uniref:Uncharacterized protein n=1 Tax=Aedes aegypti TaxID=7159 RepID=A0A6I8TY30_AEDAE|nr:zinc finger protein 2-like [Aedes aegypti]